MKASFDAKRYAWLHRGDAAAQRDPKAHFLAHGQGRDQPYLKDAPLLEYACHMVGSSLGQQVSPRRGMADALEALLAPQHGEGRRYLLARVQGNVNAQAFDAGELDRAAQALSMVLNPAKGTMMDLAAADLQADGKVYTTDQPPFDCIVILGASAEQFGTVLQKLQRLLNPERGAVIAALSSPASLRQAADAENAVAQQFGVVPQTSLQASRHDSGRVPIPNTVIGIVWEKEKASVAVAQEQQV